jgi:hypothetical protein
MKGRLGNCAAAWQRTLAIVLVAVASMGCVYLFIFPRIWHEFVNYSDVGLYFAYAQRMAHGMRPYINFALEYPPLAVSVFGMFRHADDIAAYRDSFRIVMLVITVGAAAVTAAAAATAWFERLHSYVAAVAFALAVGITGTIIANRYDAVVALDIAVCILFLVRRWYSAAAVVLGLGFALKITPAIILPLVFILDPRPRNILWRGVYFVVAAALPFCPYLVDGSRGLTHVFTYHLLRPLQIESVLALPFWTAFLRHELSLEIFNAFGSDNLRVLDAGGGAWTWHGLLTAPGMESISGPLTLVVLAAVYALAWRRRMALRGFPQLVSLAVLAILLAFMSCGKVLSPQFVIWLLPAIALVSPAWPFLGLGMCCVLALTHEMFPGQYVNLVRLEEPVIMLLIARNLLIVVMFAVSLWHLWKPSVR